MLHCKTKKQTGRVLTVVLLAACMFLNLVSIPHIIASGSAAVSPTDVSVEEPGVEETVPDASSDESGALKNGGEVDPKTFSFKAPLLQFLANTFPYTTTAGQTKTFAELFSALGISKSVSDIQSVNQ